MPLVNLPGGETIWYKKTGAGAPLVQIHGTAFGHRNFEKMTPLMAEHFTAALRRAVGRGLSARRQA